MAQFKITLRHVRESAISIRLRVLWFKRDCPTLVRKGSVEIFARSVDLATVDVISCVVGCQFDGLGLVGQGAIEVVFEQASNGRKP